MASKAVVTAVLGGSSGDSHGAVAAVDTLHLDKSALLVVLIGKADKPIATALAGHGIGHDLSRLAGWEARLEERNQNVFVDLGSEVTNEDAVFGTAVVPSINKTAARCPVKLELAGGVWDGSVVEAKGLGSGIRGLELDEAVSSVARILVADDLDIDSFTGSRQEDALNEVLVHPRLKFTHPEGGLGSVHTRPRRGGDLAHVGGGRGAVGVGHLVWGRATVGRDRERSVHFHAGGQSKVD